MFSKECGALLISKFTNTFKRNLLIEFNSHSKNIWCKKYYENLIRHYCFGEIFEVVIVRKRMVVLIQWLQNSLFQRNGFLLPFIQTSKSGCMLLTWKQMQGTHTLIDMSLFPLTRLSVFADLGIPVFRPYNHPQYMQICSQKLLEHIRFIKAHLFEWEEFFLIPLNSHINNVQLFFLCSTLTTLGQ
jgi:hypothetical protein